jgi:hypothetical protein
MTPRQLFHIAIALVVVLFLWGLVEIIGRGTNVVDERPLLVPVPAEQVDTVEIASPEDTIRLLPDVSGGWTVNGYEASASMMVELFDGLGDSISAELVAQSPSSHERMGVDDQGGTHFRVIRGDRALLHLIAGERGRLFNSRYVRLAGADEVYLLEGPLVPAFDRALNEWREKRIAEVEPDLIARVAIQHGRRAYTVERRDSTTWELSDGTPVDSAAMDRLLEGYRSLAAQGSAFATPAQVDSADFAKPDRGVTLLDERGDTLLGLAFDSTASGFWVRRAENGTVFQLFRWKGDEIAPADSVLRRKGESS